MPHARSTDYDDTMGKMKNDPCGQIEVEKTTERPIHRFSNGRVEAISDLLVIEQSMTLYLDDEVILSTACSPGNQRELAYGYLLSSGLIGGVDDVISLREAEGEIHLALRERRPDKGLASIEWPFSIAAELMLATATLVRERGEIFQRTGGTHAAAIRDFAGETIFVEDISRACAMDKAIGEALLCAVDLARTFIFLSSRISEGMLEKIARCGIPIVGCVSAPTAQAVERAQELGLCLCGFVRGERMNIYSHEERIIQ